MRLFFLYQKEHWLTTWVFLSWSCLARFIFTFFRNSCNSLDRKHDPGHVLSSLYLRYFQSNYEYYNTIYTVNIETLKSSLYLKLFPNLNLFPNFNFLLQVDCMSVLQKENDFSEEHFEYIQWHLRKSCLSFGAGLLYWYVVCIERFSVLTIITKTQCYIRRCGSET